MPIPNIISKEYLRKAILKIDEGIPEGSDSKFYDLIHNNKRYPPKSYSLDPNGFEKVLSKKVSKYLNVKNFVLKRSI